ncbi:cuticle protein 14-like isoform X1 [Limulus polyphemus]|uniref:Cuticle protein 14-like isoform X1 n=1 Tax=Limulus polyphemus TaxID=6850 RepID=A0ABM1C1J0_LIMPO|nr:cuticle protein 14-like isoform X1 [Limulus polyphemus]
MIQVLSVLGLLAAAQAGFIGGGGGGGYGSGIPIHAGGYGQQPVYPSIPTPYSFGYVAPAIGGLSARQESGDGSGRVSGSYKLSDADGRQRKVQYTAGPEGFRAHVYTNEPGTKSDNPADVTFQSSAPVPPPYYPPSKPYGYGGSVGGHHKIVVVPSGGPWE